MEILETPKVIGWRDRLMAWDINKPTPVSLSAAKVVRAEISRIKRYHNKNIRFKTWSDSLEGVDVVMVERLPDAE